MTAYPRGPVERLVLAAFGLLVAAVVVRLAVLTVLPFLPVLAGFLGVVLVVVVVVRLLARRDGTW